MGFFEYEKHVKIVGIVEIILQVLLSLFAFALVILLIFGTSILTSFVTGHETATWSLLIAITVIVVLAVAFHAWLVHLVFKGGQEKNVCHLTIWFITHSILLFFSIIANIALMFLWYTWYSITLGITFVIYRFYAIYVVHGFTVELKSVSKTSA